MIDSRILHLPTDVGGHSWALAQGERRLGANSEVLVARSNWIGYPADIALNLQKESSQLVKFYRLAKTFSSIRNKYNIFHFNFGSSLIHTPTHFFNLTELPFYPDSAKLFVTYNGCDARQKDKVIASRTIAPCHNSLCSNGACNDGRLDQSRRLAVNKMAKYVHKIWVLNPDLLDFLPTDKASFLPYSISIPNTGPVNPNLTGPLRIVHAPTSRIIKGTDYLLAALDKLKLSHGNCYELIMIENLPREQALDLYKQADVVVDQLLIGWYGSVAAESMLLGKPVIVRLDPSYYHHLPSQMVSDISDSFINADPSTIYDVLVYCLENRSKLLSLSEAAFNFASKWHNPNYVASITLEAYESA